MPLTSFALAHPEPDGVRLRLAALGVEADVRKGDPGLTAVIGGSTTLT